MKDFLELLQEGEDSAFVVLEERAKQRIARFQEKFGWFVTEFMEMKPVKRMYYLHQLQEAGETTSDFPLLFGTVLQRELVAKYKIATPSWRQYVKVGTSNDFRKSSLLNVLGGKSTLDIVPEQGEYKQANLSDAKVDIQVFKRGRKVGLSWETLINDDLGAFAGLAQDLSDVALRTEYKEATKLFVSSSGPNSTLFSSSGAANPIDGATIINKDTKTLSADNIFATVTAMRNQLDVDGEPIVFDGFTLVVPPKKEQAALEALSPAALIAVGLSSTSTKERQTSANVTAQLGIDIVVNPYLPVVDTTHGDTSWYIFAKLSNGGAVQMNFLRGHETPEITMKAPNKQMLGGGAANPLEGDFESDTNQWRVRHVLGGTQVDMRLAYAQAATS